MKNLWLVLALIVVCAPIVFGNGGAWQTGIIGTGNVRSSDKDRHTDVTIENENVKIDLHREHAAVEVRYRMHNTGANVQQEFFFPVERWGKNDSADADIKETKVENYRITVDGKDLKVTDVAGPTEERTLETSEATTEPKEESSETQEGTGETNQEGSEKTEEQTGETTSGDIWQEKVSIIKSWKKSVIPFERNQTREVVIHYDARYAENNESVSDDLHNSDATFAYSPLRLR